MYDMHLIIDYAVYTYEYFINPYEAFYENII